MNREAERRSPISLGDVIRAARAVKPRDAEAREAIREMLGVEGVADEPVQPSRGPWMSSSTDQPGESPFAAKPLAPLPGATTATTPAGSPRVGEVAVNVRRVRQGTSLPAAPDWLRSPGPVVAPPSASTRVVNVPPLFGPPRGRAILSTTLATTVLEGEIDVERIVRDVSNGRPVRHLPRRPSLTLRRGVQLLLDHGPGMDPYRFDRERLVHSLDAILSDDRLEVLDFVACPARNAGKGTRDDWTAWKPPAAGTPVVVVTDLGIGGSALDDERASPAEWLEFAHHVRSKGCVLIGLIPYEAGRWPPALARAMTLIHWSERTTVGSVRRAMRDAWERMK